MGGKPRARDLGVPFDGTPGQWNAITDVPSPHGPGSTFHVPRSTDEAEAGNPVSDDTSPLRPRSTFHVPRSTDSAEPTTLPSGPRPTDQVPGPTDSAEPTTLPSDPRSTFHVPRSTADTEIRPTTSPLRPRSTFHVPRSTDSAEPTTHPSGPRPTSQEPGPTDAADVGNPIADDTSPLRPRSTFHTDSAEPTAHPTGPRPTSHVPRSTDSAEPTTLPSGPRPTDQVPGTSPGVQVGHTTLIQGEPPLRVGVGPIRTGVTAIWPLGKEDSAAVAASTLSLNGNGEMTGTAFIEEFGLLLGPIMLTNTHSVGAVHEGVIKYLNRRERPLPWTLPVVAETYDGGFNDINGFHVKEEHVFQALDSASSGPVPEGNVGGGTGMTAYGFKGGIGTSSRKVGPHHVGVLVQANHGSRSQLRIAGVPVGREIVDSSPEERLSSSIIIVIATDAPLLPNQLKALCRRGALGLARTGAIAAMSSGDLLIAFSTANRVPDFLQDYEMRSVGAGRFTELYEATAQATEEAIVNALVAAEPMVDVKGNLVPALPHDELIRLVKRA